MKIYLSRDINQNQVLIEKIKENLTNGLYSYYFVPDQYTLFSDINILQGLSEDVLMDVKVKSFSSFSDEILSRHGGLRKQVLSKTGKNMILRQVLINNKDKLDLFSKNINSKGFTSQLARSIEEFKDADIGYEKLNESLDDLDPIDRTKLSELALVFQAYEKAIQGKYIDSNDRLSLLYEKLDLAHELKGTHFFFDKYNSLSSQELLIIEKLEDLGAKIHFFLILDPSLVDKASVDEVDDGELFDSSFALFNKLRSISKNLEIIGLPSTAKTDRAFLARNIFSFRPKTSFEKSHGVKVIECKNTEEEIKFVTELIKNKIIEDQARYNDFTIITSNEGEYNKFIKRIFTQEKIPFFLDSKESLLDNKLAIFLVSCLRLIVNNFRAEDIGSFLKFGFKDLDTGDIEIFEKYLKSRKIKGQMIFNDDYFELDKGFMVYLKEDQVQVLLDKLNSTRRVREFFINIIGPYNASSKSKAPINTHIANFFKLIYSSPVKESLETFIDSQKDDDRLSSYNEQTWDYFISTLNELADMQGGSETSFQDFASILISGFEEQNIGLIPPYQDVVFIGSTQRTRTNPSKYMVLVGINDTYFPSSTKTCSLIDDDERKILKDKGLDLVMQDKVFKAEEFMNFYSNILKAKETLYISSSLTDSTNKNLPRSLYFSQVSNILKNVEIISSHKFMNNLLYSKTLITDEVLFNLEEKLSNKIPIEERDINLLSYLYKSGDRKTQAAISRLEEPQRILGKPSDLYKSSKISVSRIQTYARCPYKHFVRYGLSPEEELSYDIERREIGNIAHSTLADFVKAYRKNPDYFKNMDQDEFKNYIYRLLDKDISYSIDKKRVYNSKNKLVLDVAKSSIYTGVKNIARQLNLSSFMPKLVEAKFGEARDLPGIKIDTGSRIIELEGIIDRVDSLALDGDDNIIVIDYKTGSQSFDLSLALNGIDIQLPIYLHAATRAGENSKKAGFFYLPIKDLFISDETEDEELILDSLIKKLAMDGVVIRDERVLSALDSDIETKPSVIKFQGRTSKILEKDNVLGEDALNRLVDDVVEVTQTNVREIFAGLIQAKPIIDKSTSECSRCDYKNICKFDLRKNKDYRLIEPMGWGELEDGK